MKINKKILQGLNEATNPLLKNFKTIVKNANTRYVKDKNFVLNVFDRDGKTILDNIEVQVPHNMKFSKDEFILKSKGAEVAIKIDNLFELGYDTSGNSIDIGIETSKKDIDWNVQRGLNESKTLEISKKLSEIYEKNKDEYDRDVVAKKIEDEVISQYFKDFSAYVEVNSLGKTSLGSKVTIVLADSADLPKCTLHIYNSEEYDITFSTFTVKPKNAKMFTAFNRMLDEFMEDYL